ncbi:MAG: S4 domain-containing protein YaaA [Aerococcus sp.]|nr:S4 domain-containing protein YaaA [Aerococcus sp.]
MEQEQFFVTIDEEYITLTQLLKALAIIQTGGQVKPYLQNNEVWVDGELEQRRGRKLYPGMHVQFANVEGDFIIEAESEATTVTDNDET